MTTIPVWRPAGQRERTGGGSRSRAPRRRPAAVLAALAVLVTVVAVPATARVAGASEHRAATDAAPLPGAATVASTHLIVAAAPGPGDGYWLVATDGGVFAFGGAAFHGSTGAIALNRPIVGMAATPDGGGYWLVASDGGIFAFGDARFLGSMGATPLNRPVVGMAATPDGGGYWLVASDGGIFAFGDARFLGSMGATPLNRPVVGMAATPGGGGYRMVASDGGIFAFGDATFLGSMGGTPLDSPVVGMAADPGGVGYRMVAADGGVFCFDSAFAGSAVGQVRRAVVSLVAGTTGYRIVASDGGVYTFGGAPYSGSVTVPPLVGEVVTIDPGHDGGNASDPAFIDRPIDGGGLIEPCDTAGTTDLGGYDEHAFNFDVATRLAALLRSGGATIVLTRPDDTGVGPCVDTRAAIGNLAGSDAAVSIHADGGPPGGRGFAVDVPVPVVSPVSDDRSIVAPSGLLGDDIRDHFLADTAEPVSDYTGTDGIVPRGDLGGLDLSTVPKVLVECLNMQNPADTALDESPQWRQSAAQGLADGITAFLVQREVP